MADDYGPETYGDRIADVYDEWYGDAGFLEKEASVELLAELAGDGPCWSSRSAPAGSRSRSPSGASRCTASTPPRRWSRSSGRSPAATDIPVTMGDFADVPVEGIFSLVFVAFNTFFGLPSQEAQVRCFANAAAHLAEGGVFLIEAFVPDLARFDRNQRFQTNSVEPDGGERSTPRATTRSSSGSTACTSC